jgi:hypothetical protein
VSKNGQQKSVATKPETPHVNAASKPVNTSAPTIVSDQEDDLPF